MINSTQKMLSRMSRTEVNQKAVSPESDSSAKAQAEIQSPSLADFMNCLTKKDNYDLTPFS
ncbi:hypothetical protein DIZ81_06190 [Legionella taurinensis]|uniref:Uncharacterized protein n=1 Tax=Legionella taurinensis TaxID=70611 RepID=A0A3A5LJC0_9GAMM|nr:hypothetical protein [Legionella taurinensis]MDX1837507.1 hypothetical protein [Legionella taurinensis]PUT40848.1 hypothetical protein DB744_06190 [Legionella taurinensis]PUT44269.1 hypothetical protein DB746_04590 [Legionella taurinensis]PUT47571.1 hypothetical protein DB743_02760 [Legionella taurinensis]PUT48710.1 hypothetical protein DB745_04590 [Legionella taurinensis]